MRVGPVSARTAFVTYPIQAAKTSPSPGKKDSVTISDEGIRMQAQNMSQTTSLLSSLDNFMDGAGKDGIITLDEIKAFGDKYFNIATDILSETLEQLGISSDHDISVRTDREGVVRIDSGLSAQDNKRLEAALNDHPDFQQAFTKASSSQATLDAAEKYLEFAEAYAQNPTAAVAKFGIGKKSLGEYVLQYTMEQASLLFEE